jgi:hypothetical protein
MVSKIMGKRAYHRTAEEHFSVPAEEGPSFPIQALISKWGLLQKKLRIDLDGDLGMDDRWGPKMGR